MGDNDQFQPLPAAAQHQDTKRPFRRWLIAAVVALLIIASIGGFYLHWSSTYPTLYASYSGNVGTVLCNPLAIGWTGTISLDQVVEDHTHGTFTGLISASDGCALSCNADTRGTVTLSGNISFTCEDYVHFSGMILSDGGIEGQYYYYGTTDWGGNFCLNGSASAPEPFGQNPCDV